MDLFPYSPIGANENVNSWGNKPAPGDNSCAAIIAVPYSMGPAQILALPVIVVCLAKLAYHRFNIFFTHTKDLFSAGNRYAREVYKIHEHNKSIKCICIIVFSVLSIIPLAGPLGVMAITGIWRRLAIFCQKELVVDKKDSYFTRDAWPGVDLTNVPENLFKKIHLLKEGEKKPNPYKIYSPPHIDYETVLSHLVF